MQFNPIFILNSIANTVLLKSESNLSYQMNESIKLSNYNTMTSRTPAICRAHFSAVLSNFVFPFQSFLLGICTVYFVENAELCEFNTGLLIILVSCEFFRGVK
jgi:hypothetical protein